MLTLLKPELEEYAFAKTSTDGALLQELTAETYEKMEVPQMLTGRLEGRFLKLMVQISSAKRVLEIGMFTGYSALSMAEGLPENGELITCDINPKAIEVAKRFFARSEHGRKITIMEGPALESIARLNGSFDLAFIDADKANYTNYYEAIMPLMKSGGVILIDNVFYSGEVVDPKSKEAKAIAALNDRVSQDNRVEAVFLTIRDGVYFIRKK